MNFEYEQKDKSPQKESSKTVKFNTSPETLLATLVVVAGLVAALYAVCSKNAGANHANTQIELEFTQSFKTVNEQVSDVAGDFTLTK